MNIITYSEILTHLVGLLGLSIFGKFNERFLYIVLLLTGYTCINELLAYSYSVSVLPRRYNTPFYVIYSIFAYPIFLISLKEIVNNSFWKRAVIFFIIVYIISSIAEIIVKTGMFRYHFMSMAMGCVFVVVLCLVCLKELLNNDLITRLLGESKFWFLCGTLFFHFLLLTYIFVHDNFNSKEIQDVNKNIMTIANLVFYSFTTIAFLCQWKKTS